MWTLYVDLFTDRSLRMVETTEMMSEIEKLSFYFSFLHLINSIFLVASSKGFSNLTMAKVLTFDGFIIPVVIVTPKHLFLGIFIDMFSFCPVKI